MDMYKTSYEDFGRLSCEMWRACRLVVDTGMHWKGWSREQALDYLRQNTTLSEHEVRTETDRYIAWPGQALGPKFDLRTFHDVVLAQGTITLPNFRRTIRV